MKRNLTIPSQLFRSGASTLDAEKKTIRLSIASDEPYLRQDWMTGEQYLEVLDHSEKGMDATRLKTGTPLLFNHDRNILLGRNTYVGSDGKKSYVDAQISNAADVASYRTKIEEGILCDSSVGYSISDEGEEIGQRDGIPIIRFKWTPYEASLVTIPADQSVGIGRQRDASGKPELVEISVTSKKDVDETSKGRERQIQQTKPMAETTIAPAAETKPNIDVSATRNEGIAEERKRVAGINELVKHFANVGCMGRKVDTREIAEKAIADGASVRDFQDAVVRGNPPAVQSLETPEVGLSKKEKKEWSMVRAMRLLASKNPLDGLEKEASDAHAKLIGKEVDGMGFFIPQDVMQSRALRSYSREGAENVRALFAGTYSGAGALVADDLSAFTLIELLRNQMLVVQMGARSLSGLRGNVPIPRQTGGCTASWLAEDSTISATQQTVGQLNLTPHKLAAATAYTQQLLAQSSIDVENFVRQDMMAVIAIARDLAAISGSGVSGQPLGIINTTGLSTNVTLASVESLTYAKAVAFETNVSLNNANTGKLAYMTSVGAKGNAKLLAEIASTNSNPVWKDDRVNGYPAMATNQMPTANGVLFGNWDDLILADWAETSVIVDPYSLSLQGQIRIVMQMMCDNGLRHAASFAKGVL